MKSYLKKTTACPKNYCYSLRILYIFYVKSLSYLFNLIFIFSYISIDSKNINHLSEGIDHITCGSLIIWANFYNFFLKNPLKEVEFIRWYKVVMLLLKVIFMLCLTLMVYERLFLITSKSCLFITEQVISLPLKKQKTKNNLLFLWFLRWHIPGIVFEMWGT